MIRIASRTRLHTDEQIEEAVKSALAVAAGAALDADDRALLLPTILTLTAAAHVNLEQLSLEPPGRLLS